MVASAVIVDALVVDEARVTAESVEASVLRRAVLQRSPLAQLKRGYNNNNTLMDSFQTEAQSAYEVAAVLAVLVDRAAVVVVCAVEVVEERVPIEMRPEAVSVVDASKEVDAA